MLTITIPSGEQYDEANNSFVNSKAQTLQLEHSLVSISKWESKWCKPFLSKDDKTFEESVDYMRCMTLTQNIDPECYNAVTSKLVQEITDYIAAPMTATILPKNNKSSSRETVTSELIYYWMVAMTIPFECQKWHLNRLLTLINVCNIKNQPQKKMSKGDLNSRNRSLNEARRNTYNTTG